MAPAVALDEGRHGAIRLDEAGDLVQLLAGGIAKADDEDGGAVPILTSQVSCSGELGGILVPQRLGASGPPRSEPRLPP